MSTETGAESKRTGEGFLIFFTPHNFFCLFTLNYKVL